MTENENAAMCTIVFLVITIISFVSINMVTCRIYYQAGRVDGYSRARLEDKDKNIKPFASEHVDPYKGTTYWTEN